MATIPFAINVYMRPHIAMLAEYYDVTLISNGNVDEFELVFGKNIHFINVNIERKISLISDFMALIHLYKIFYKERFDVVHSLMPKTALLAMVAAYVARVPYRIHTFTGQVWANKVGVKRYLLKTFDRIISTFATNLLADGLTQKQFLVEEKIVEDGKIEVLGNGSVCGVNIQRFKPNLSARNQVRAELNIPQSAFIFLYLGRLNYSKGVQDLAKAFKAVAINNINAHLLIVGPDEDELDGVLTLILEDCLSQYHRVGYTSKPENYMACADVFCLPSYREGFGSVIIEAAAVGLPSVASKIYGLADSVKDGATGIFHQPGNVEEITNALLKLMNESKFREKMSIGAINRARDLFSETIVVNEMRKYYKGILN